ncbi:uncharacterized protein EURHEDRAFT_513868 [Aspergillus ruber CBS 135680]|uniref:Dienelactone hydrolase domain-containing protein n=1 Tax=Aspergillus ruber (strain CBS 135680) TaxID=1388766 RepID=A0A017SKJ9_ASPRC|nr:uncharacterized protein EURHEDRAFT_513868 [Aspergillus ruber CBS 135680]EYE97301.1 hypothetical protein EURHEDRAFT_513868 [Aspergillus ruber CBS 135680]
MTSNPPEFCCVIGVNHDSEPRGQIRKIGNIEAYVFYPANCSTNQLARNGSFVVMPDLFHSDPIVLNRPADYNFMVWLRGPPPPGNWPNRVDPVVHSVLTDTRGGFQCQRIGLVGYCFGASETGYVAHPSFVEAAELNDIKGPLSITAADRHESEEILARTSQPYKINIFSGVEHGFAVRADIYKSHARFAKECAFCQAVAWFNQYL